MGMAKREWMEYQELEPMYDWIEENYGDDAGEEGSEEWNKAVAAYEEHCEEVMLEEARLAQQDEFDYYIFMTLKDADSIFDRDIKELRHMLLSNTATQNNHTLLKMIIAHSVTVLEVYLEDITKSLITSNDKYLSNTIKNVRPFSDTPFKLSELSFDKDGIRKFVLGKLSENLYHDIPKVVNIIGGVIGRKIKIQIDDVCRSTKIRHDIVHRNGRDTEGEQIDISHALALDILQAIESFVNQLHIELSTL